MSNPIVAIGMPVYQGGADLERALSSLTGQSFEDWILTVADNASTDETAEVVSGFAQRDKRVRYLRHSENIGASANFVYLAQQASAPYFMWAAADDEYSLNYVAECLRLLVANPGAGLSGGSIVNIDTLGATVRRYEKFSDLDSTSNIERLARYTSLREIDGKANLIYSLFRTELIKEICYDPQVLAPWGADMALVTAALARAPYLQAQEAILYKRVKSPGDTTTARQLAAGDYTNVEFHGNFPLLHFGAYFKAVLGGLRSWHEKAIVATILIRRLGSVIGWRVAKALGR